MASPPLSWHQSGQGEVPISLQDAQRLAVASGFVFKGSEACDRLPLARRADLQGMFEHFGVNSLTAFRHKFWGQALHPDRPCGGGEAARAAARLAAPRSRWRVVPEGEGSYVGEVLDGKRHGKGALLARGPRAWVLHAGEWAGGVASGPGVVATSRGERMEAYFLDGLAWGPGEYRYAGTAGGPAEAAAGAGAAAAGGATAAAAAGGAPPPAHRVRYAGMLNGQPRGRGCMVWSDGRRLTGQFDGNRCYQQLKDDELAGVLAVAADNARDARGVAAAVLEQAAQQAPDIAAEAQRLFAAVGWPGQARAPEDQAVGL